MDQVTLISGRERRRHWSGEGRARTLAAISEPDAVVAEIGRREDICTSLRRARKTVPSRRRRQGHGLHADPLAGVHALPRRRTGLPHQQRRRAGAARHRPRPQILVIRGIATRGGTHRPHVRAHPDRQAERCRSAGLARRRARPHRRYSANPPQRVAPVELAPRPSDPNRRLTAAFTAGLPSARGQTAWSRWCATAGLIRSTERIAFSGPRDPTGSKSSGGTGPVFVCTPNVWNTRILPGHRWAASRLGETMRSRPN